MPPKFRFTREEIVHAALALTAEGGAKAVTARALAAKLGSSAKPIFGLFENMEELQRAVLAAAFEKYSRFIAAEMTKGEYAPYKASGMAYIRFARDERELFKLLFMRERSREEQLSATNDDVKPLLQLIIKNTGMTEAVIAGALFGVAQDVIGLGSFLELLFGFGVTGVVVGMVAHGQLAIGFFDLVLAGAAVHPQNFVIVSLCHGL